MLPAPPPAPAAVAAAALADALPGADAAPDETAVPGAWAVSGAPGGFGFGFAPDAGGLAVSAWRFAPGEAPWADAAFAPDAADAVGVAFGLVGLSPGDDGRGW